MSILVLAAAAALEILVCNYPLVINNEELLGPPHAISEIKCGVPSGLTNKMENVVGTTSLKELAADGWSLTTIVPHDDSLVIGPHYRIYVQRER